MRIRRTLLSALLGAWSVSAQAVTLSFFCITGNNPGDCAIGEAQLTVDVTDIGAGQVNFQFANAGPEVSSISEVYFDDGALFGLASVFHSEGDSWTGGSANPGDLPGGNNVDPDFMATQGFLAESNPSPSQNGVRPSEYLDVVFDLQAGMTFANVINDLATGDLRVGMHVIAFESGGSESFVNNPVPVPAAVWLFGSGLLMLTGIARRRA
jgi:hypothetical protein